MKANVILVLFWSLFCTSLASNAKTLVVYYSFTNNVHTIVSDLQTQVDADVIRIEPAEKGIDYAANGYAVGSALITAIRNHPNEASSYPAIDPVEVNMADYDMVIIAAPLWWGNMAAPLQTFLFQYGQAMAGKHIGLIVSSASSGISAVVTDAKRLIPQGLFLEPNLWIRSSQTPNCHRMISGWLSDVDYSHITSVASAIGNEPATQIIGRYNLQGQKMSLRYPSGRICLTRYKRGNKIYTKKTINR